jgi:hypothetical protein
VQTLTFGHPPYSVELLAVEPLSEAPTPAASLEADREHLLAHPLVFRDKVLFSTVTRTYLGFLAGIQACQPLLAAVPGPAGPQPVVSPLIPVVWSHDGKQEEVDVHLLLGLKRQENAPDTFAERSPPKPAGTSLRYGVWLATTFTGMTTLSLALGQWWSTWAAIAVSIGLVSGGIVAGVLQEQVFSRVRAPEPEAPDQTGYWDTVRVLANRQIAMSALPGAWTVAAIPAGLAPARDWSLEIGAVVIVLITGLLLRWPPPGM